MWHKYTATGEAKNMPVTDVTIVSPLSHISPWKHKRQQSESPVLTQNTAFNPE